MVLTGQMMDRPLLISSILRHAAIVHRDGEVSARFGAEPSLTYTYSDAHDRVMRLANALVALGIKPGDRVATLMWNDHRHFELYYAISGIGAVCHTINPRLFPEQIAFIVNHAEDAALFIDPMFLKLLDGIGPHLRTLRHVIVAAPTAPAQAGPFKPLAYEDLLDAHPPAFDWPELPESAAAGLCYTSGTTGDPKGVLYSHRSQVLHALGVLACPGVGVHGDDVVLPVVPFFHVNGWGYPFVCPIVGAKLALPGPKLDGASVAALINEERVTMAAGVPTVWLGLYNHCKESGARLPTLTHILFGGSAMPQGLADAFESELGVEAMQGWGMTELSPVGTFSSLPRAAKSLPREARLQKKLKQGRPLFGVEARIVDEDGRPLAHDGVATGELAVRGPWVTGGYYRDEQATKAAFTQDGWFKTGDVATIDPDGVMTIVDRAKDVIKSGGEWISSLEVEAAAATHPKVALAAVIGAPHPKWDERPVMFVKLKQGVSAEKGELLDHLNGRIAKWWIPDDVLFVEELPLGATGKVDKKQLRKSLAAFA